MISRIRLPIQVLTVMLCATHGSAQENRGTEEQRAACAPDAFRLCIGFIPDPTGVEQCLRRNEPDLSEACRSVFAQSAAPVATSSPRMGPGRPTRAVTSQEAE
jgi:hypothetical protein